MNNIIYMADNPPITGHLNHLMTQQRCSGLVMTHSTTASR